MGASLLTLSLEGSGTEIEGVAVIGPVSDAGELGLLDGEVEQNSVKLDFAILESGGAALYSLAGQVENEVMRGEATRRSLHGKNQTGYVRGDQGTLKLSSGSLSLFSLHLW